MIAAVLAFWIVCAGFLILPFVPALLEWRRPSDRSPLPVPVAYGAEPSHFANQLRVKMRELLMDAKSGNADSVVFAEALHGPAQWMNAKAPVLVRDPMAMTDSVCCQEVVYAASDFQAAGKSSFFAIMCAGNLQVGSGSEILGWAHADRKLHLGAWTLGLRRLSCGEEMRLERGCCFERIHAPRIDFGDGCSEAPRPATGERTRREWSALPGAQRSSEVLFHFSGNCDVPDASHIVGSVVVDGALAIGAGSLIEGDIKSHKGVFVSAGAQVHGSVVSDGSIHLRPWSHARGPVVTDGSVLLARGCSVGTLEQPSTITASVILVETGAVAHGTVWARQQGVVWGLV